MAPEDGATSAERNTAGGGGNGGVAPRGSGGGAQVMKKGPWTAAEDAILMEYVKKHGEGNWNAVQRNSGLMRCGKSCRLRWANHLRPNLKKGAFTPEEERQIIELHSKFGNKWARMALHLQGRTDNEIKNYWNTRLKRRQRAGLPIYPVDFHHHHHHRQHHEQSMQTQILASSSSTSSPHHLNSNFNPINPMSLFDTMNFPALSASLRLSHSQSQFKLLRDNNGGVALSLPSTSNIQFETSLSSVPVFNQGLPSFNYDMNLIPKTEPSFNEVRVSENFENELPSIQSSFQAMTPTSSCNTVNDNMVVPSSDGDNYEIGPGFCQNGNSGLLGDVLGESRALLSSQMCCNEDKSKQDDKGKGKIMNDYALMEEPHSSVKIEPVFGLGDHDTPHLEDSSSGHSSIEMGIKSQGDVFEEINIVDDDFSSWLDFPVTGPFQEWYGGSDDASTDQKPAGDVSNVNMCATDNQREVSCSPVAMTIKSETDDVHDHDWTLGSCCWNNMPGFS